MSSNIFKQWYAKRFSDPAAMILFISLIIGALIVIFFGNILAPLFAAIVIAFLLEAIVVALTKYCHFPRWLAVSFAYLLFIGILIVAILYLIPLLCQQFSQAVSDFPNMMQKFHQYLSTLPKKYPTVLSNVSAHDLISSTAISSDKIATWGKMAWSLSIASLPSIVSWIVYLFLVPLLVLFFLKDKDRLLNWCRKYMPAQRSMIDNVWHEMQIQLGNYVRGKVVEVIIVWLATYIGFKVFGLHYASLLAFFVGLSVIIPYVGMIVVTIPVLIVGLLQWGWGVHFAYMIIVYAIIQALDANVLVPLLFSEKVNIHPVAIVAAVLFFGGIWGFWGLFFAIPLATLVKAVIDAMTRIS